MAMVCPCVAEPDLGAGEAGLGSVQCDPSGIKNRELLIYPGPRGCQCTGLVALPCHL